MNILKMKWNELSEKIDNVVKDRKYMVMGLWAIGALILAKHSLQSICSLYKTFIRPGKDLYKRYQGGYVVITGATFGLGLEYAKHFASLGFNLVLIARNKDRLNNTKLEIEELNSKTDIKTIVFDFDVPYTDNNYDDLKNELLEIENISVLINNVGAFTQTKGCFHEMQFNDINTLIQVNWIPIAFLTRILLPKMLERSQKQGKRWAILNISSVASFTKLGKAALYAATKAYDRTLSNILHKEVGNDIDVVSIIPGPWRSNMIRFSGPFVIQPDQHVKWALSDVGYDTQTFGHYSHYLYRNAYRFPYFEAWYTRMRNNAQLDPVK